MIAFVFLFLESPLYISLGGVESLKSHQFLQIMGRGSWQLAKDKILGEMGYRMMKNGKEDREECSSTES